MSRIRMRPRIEMQHRSRGQCVRSGKLGWHSQFALGLAFCLCILAASAVLVLPSRSAAPSKLEPALLKQVLEGRPDNQYHAIIELTQTTDLTRIPQGLSRSENRHRVVTLLQATAKQAQTDLLALLEAGRAEGRVEQIRPFWILNGIAVIADGETLMKVAARPEVRTIREDRWRRWLDPAFAAREQSIAPVSGPAAAPNVSADGAEWNIARVRAHLVWQTLGLNGRGVTVALMDTGVDWQHPLLQAQYRGYKAGGVVKHEGNWASTTDQDPLYPVDGSGHGTHVAGIAVGGRDAGGRAVGMAPGARWIAVKMLNNQGWGYDSWIHAAFQWLMAPDGDPGLAPDVVNGSWGARNGEDETFRPDVQALRAAGIIPIFAAGNHGPDISSLGNPASYPEAIAVGAGDDVDSVVRTSSRGPSPWGEVKPEVVAPGIQIRSSTPGGTYTRAGGTSMAAPHVTGLVALLLQADPVQTVDGIEALLTSTALPLADVVPNNDTGWGRVDAYQAVAVALQAGYVSGRVTDLPDQDPLPATKVTVRDDAGQQIAAVTTDDLGKYRLALPQGRYDLRFDAFGFKPETERGVRVQAAMTSTLDRSLRPLPAGMLQGLVKGAQTGEPLAAGLSIIDTPARTASDPQTGRYSLALPAGTYSLLASRNGSRRYTRTGVKILADQVTEVDIALAPAPTLLLVDSGHWYYESQAKFFEQALADRDYVYDTWPIRDLAQDLPGLDDLATYDIVIWSSPTDSPGLIGAGDVISNYLGTGGNLFLTGQDVGFWDDGLSGWSWHEYYGQFLKARALDDDAGRDDLIGVAGEMLDGLVLQINGPDSASNQRTPDLISLRDPRGAAIIGHYGDDGRERGEGKNDPASENIGNPRGADQGGDVRAPLVGALRAWGCSPYPGKSPYRTLYLAAGLEGLGTGYERAEAMDRSLVWLDTPHPSAEAELYPPRQDEVWLAGQSITYTVELRNGGQFADRFDLALSPSFWPAAVWDSDFSQPIAQSLNLSSCQTQTLGIEITVPPGVIWNATDVVTLTATSRSDPGQSATASFHSKAPAPILLVDDHRWYATTDDYRTALEANGYPYDVWRVEPDLLPAAGSPTLQRLHSYPVVVWFTAYDWHRTLTAHDEALLAAYLEGGGRLLLSSQDYFYTSGLTEFANHYLGVAGYTENVTSTQVMGAAGSPIGNGLPAMELRYPFGNWSDALRPTSVASIAFWGQHGQPVAMNLVGPSRSEGAWRSAYFAIPLEALQAPDMAAVVGQTVGWLSALGDSAFAVDRPVVDEGKVLAYTLHIRNTGPLPLIDASLANNLPDHTKLVVGSLEGPAVYEPDQRRLVWHGPLPPGQTVKIDYRLQLDPNLPTGTLVQNVARLRDESGLVVERVATSRVGTPDLSGSAKVASTGTGHPGQILTYTLSLRNKGLRPAKANLIDSIPPLSTYVPGSAQASTGRLDVLEDAVLWSGLVAEGEAVTLGFSVSISPMAGSLYVHNRALLDDGWGDLHPLEVATWVEARALLPFVGKQQ